MPSRFVVQEHHARTHHYDFRLEKDGAFKSWAVPRGIPEAPGVRRLAVQVPDHPMAWGSFEGTIPEGRYGAGTVAIWDEGTYDILEWTDEAIRFVLHGRRVRGPYALVRFRNKGPRDWLLFRKSDPQPQTQAITHQCVKSGQSRPDSLRAGTTFAKSENSFVAAGEEVASIK